MAQSAKIEDSVHIWCASRKAYNFFKNDLTDLTKIVPQLFKSVKVVDGKKGEAGGVVQYEFYILGEKTTLKLKIEEIDDSKRTLTFTAVHEGCNHKKTILVVQIKVNNDSVTWALQFANSSDVGPTTAFTAKAAIDLIIKALDIYLLFK